jgi:protein unc-119
MQKVSQSDVLSLKNITPNFLCPLSANIYDIQFLAFKIRDVDSNTVFFQIENDEETTNEEKKIDFELDEQTERELRTIRYYFGPNFFKLSKIGTTLTFSIGKKEVKNFKMIERHYFKNQLVQSFEFQFPFCIPNTTNTLEAIYEIPKLSPELVREMIACPWETKSDSFYFVGDELVMHNKAEYSYAEKLEEA